MIASAQEASREISRLRTALIAMELDQVDEDADGSNIKISDWDLATPSNPPPSDPDLLMNSDYSQSEYSLSRDVSDFSSSTDRRRNGDSNAYLKNVMVPFDEQEDPESRNKRRRGGSGNRSGESGSKFHDDLELYRDENGRQSSGSARESNSAGNSAEGVRRQPSSRSLIHENIVRQPTQRSFPREEDIDGQGHPQHNRRQDQGSNSLSRNPSLRGDAMRQASTRSLQQLDRGADSRGGSGDQRRIPDMQEQHRNYSTEDQRNKQPPVRQQSNRQLQSEQCGASALSRGNSIRSIDSVTTNMSVDSQVQRDAGQISNERLRMPSYRNLHDNSSAPSLQGQVRQQSQRSLDTQYSEAPQPQRQQADNIVRSNDGKLRSMPPKRGAMNDLFNDPPRINANYSEFEQEVDYIPSNAGNRQPSMRNIQTDSSYSNIPTQLPPQRQPSQRALQGQSDVYNANAPPITETQRQPFDQEALRQPSRRSPIAPANAQYENPDQMLQKQETSRFLNDSDQHYDGDRNVLHNRPPSEDGSGKSSAIEEQNQNMNYQQPMRHIHSSGMGNRQASVRSLQSNYSIPEETPDDLSEQSEYAASMDRNAESSQVDRSRLPLLQQQSSARNVLMGDAQPSTAANTDSYVTQANIGAAANRGQLTQQQSSRNITQGPPGQQQNYSPQGGMMQSRQSSTRSLNNNYSSASPGGFVPDNTSDRSGDLRFLRADSNRSLQSQDQQQQRFMPLDSRQASQRSLLPSDDGTVPEDPELIRHEQQVQSRGLRHQASNRSLGSNYSFPEEFLAQELSSGQYGLPESSNYHLDFLTADEAPESFFPQQSVVAGH